MLCRLVLVLFWRPWAVSQCSTRCHKGGMIHRFTFLRSVLWWYNNHHAADASSVVSMDIRRMTFCVSAISGAVQRVFDQKAIAEPPGGAPGTGRKAPEPDGRPGNEGNCRP